MAQIDMDKANDQPEPVHHKLRKWLTEQVRDHPAKLVLVILVVIPVLILLAYWIIWADISPEWTGFGPYDEEQSGPRAKTIWDWLDLLIVPAVLGLGAYWLNNAQKKTELKIADEQRREERRIADEQRKVDLQIARDQQQQATLEAYFDKMTELLLNHDLRIKVAENDEERTIARARTLTVLRSLDGLRKGLVIRFLHEAGLIKASSGEAASSETLLVLDGADLSEAVLIEANLSGADLSGVNLYKAKMEKVNLRQVNLRKANLEEARLVSADLSEARLEFANLHNADMRGTELRVTQLLEANLSKAKLNMAYLGGANLRGANLEGAVLREAFLQANLTLAKLFGADLRMANLSGADLTMAKLSRADLREAKLNEANLSSAEYNEDTKWPERFEPLSEGCILVKSI